jgi:histidyl-tRNA synthetase
MGIRDDGHPEKEGVLVDLKDLVAEVRTRISRNSKLDGIVKHAEGLRVVGGIRGEPEAAAIALSGSAETPEAESASAAATDSAKAVGDDAVPDTEKPAEESLHSQEAIGAIPAS